MKALAMVGRLLPCYGPRASLEKALRERDEARAEYKQAMEWNVCQIENVAEGLRMVEELRREVTRLSEDIDRQAEALRAIEIQRDTYLHELNVALDKAGRLP